MGQKYIDKIKKYRKTTGQQTALLIASGMINNLSAVIVCFNPKFGGGSFGPAENEHFLKATEIAMNKKVDLLIKKDAEIELKENITDTGFPN